MGLFDRHALMWVTDRIRSDAPLPELASRLDDAVDLIQIRERGLDRLPLELLVRAVSTVAGSGTRIVVNGEIELARKLGIGVHLPEHGPSLVDARDYLGSEALIGRSVHSLDSAAASAGASYLVAGHVFTTTSKPGLEPIGPEELAEIVAVASVPVLAIGGITPENVPAVMAAGVAGVAVMGPLTRFDTIGDVSAAYRNALEHAVTEPKAESISATINGKFVELATGTTVTTFLAGRELHERLVVVERNGEILKRASFPETVIEEGDLLEIVHFVGGG